MQNYRAPLRDVLFSLNELHDYPAHYQTLALAEGLGIEDAPMVLGEMGRFAEQVLLPLNASGDREGAHWDGQAVTAPAGFREAYHQYVEAGWPRLGYPEEQAGQPAPYSLKLAGSEFLQSANGAWCMYATLNDGAVKTLQSFAGQEQVDAFVPKLISGEWTGTMCLTEPQCGSDLNLVRTRAEPVGDGRYRIHGTKIFISSGEHDWTDNIVHLVLARLPDAPPGTRGISLFVVPKRLPDADGVPGEMNRVRCIAIEDKMGLKGSATCAMAFDGAEGWLVGPPNRGLNCMFVYINKSRLGVGLQGVAQAEAAFQGSLDYAQTRLQGRAPEGRHQPADPLVAHPDIRRMLLTQRAIAEGGRALVHLCAKWIDVADGGSAAQREEAEQRLALLTPIAKGLLSELASEVTDLAIQILGGHGYIKESGLEQRVRDVRITRIYEGTTGIQGMDLLGRKVLGPQRAVFDRFVAEILAFCESGLPAELAPLQQRLRQDVAMWRDLTDELARRAPADPLLVGAVGVDYLMLSGYVTLGYLWLRSAAVAAQKLAAECGEQAFYRAKLQTARFYFDKLLPRTAVHRQCILNGSESLATDAALLAVSA
jgi:alkylation response protein AidB-like acyl-CoA dehydrogenase